MEMVKLTLKAFAIWWAILALAVANGALREALLLPAMGKPVAFVVSGLLLCGLIVGLSYVALPWLKARRRAHLCWTGLGWLGLTLVFEFSLGLMQGKSWGVMLDAYRFQDGNLWPVVLAVTATAPFTAALLRGWVNTH